MLQGDLNRMDLDQQENDTSMKSIKRKVSTIEDSDSDDQQQQQPDTTADGSNMNQSKIKNDNMEKTMPNES